MTLYWLGDAVLILVVLPVVVYLLRGVSRPRAGSCRTSRRSRDAAAAGSRTSTRCRCCSPRRTRSSKPSPTVADYGGSLDMIVDDA